jgi:isopentenyl-diphosphate delta-isomerase
MKKNADKIKFQMTEADELLEVIDEAKNTLMIMPRAQVQEQRLAHKVVLVALKNRENKIYIHKRAQGKIFSGLWSISASGHVLAGESFEDAAMRELAEELGIKKVKLTAIADTGPNPDTADAWIRLFLSKPASFMVNPDPREIDCGMFVDQEELEALLTNMPELAGPGLRWAYASCNLFRE